MQIATSMTTAILPSRTYSLPFLRLPIERQKRTHIYIAFATLDDLLSFLSRLSWVAGQSGHALSYGIKEIQVHTEILSMVFVRVTTLYCSPGKETKKSQRAIEMSLTSLRKLRKLIRQGSPWNFSASCSSALFSQVIGSQISSVAADRSSPQPQITNALLTDGK